jgi:hypothetical protein
MARPGRGSGGGPPPGQDFGEFVRRELHAAADQVEPGADGLERIRARVQSGMAYATAGQPGAATVLWSLASLAGYDFLADMVRRWYAKRGGHGAAPAHGAGHSHGAGPGHGARQDHGAGRGSGRRAP